MTAKELIEAYNIFDAGNGQIGIKNVTRIKKDNMIDEVKARKKEILEVFEAEKRAEKERFDKIAAIEGLNEIIKIIGKKETIVIADLYSLLADNNKSLPVDMTLYGVHLTKEAYDKITNYILPMLTKEN